MTMAALVLLIGTVAGCSRIAGPQHREEWIPFRTVPVESVPLPPPRPEYILKCYVEDQNISGSIVTKRYCKREYIGRG
jgi:hypothetical protein